VQVALGPSLRGVGTLQLSNALLQQLSCMLVAALPQICVLHVCRERFDLCLALHACGHATDEAMLQAHRSRAAMIVSPCCVGKLVFAPQLSRGGASARGGVGAKAGARAVGVEGAEVPCDPAQHGNCASTASEHTSSSRNCAAAAARANNRDVENAGDAADCSKGAADCFEDAADCSEDVADCATAAAVAEDCSLHQVPSLLASGGVPDHSGGGTLPQCGMHRRGAGGRDDCIGSFPQQLLQHPRSTWMRSALRDRVQFETLAKADFSHVEQHGYPEEALVAKVRQSVGFL
jgi:hypothetical protein